MAPVPCQPPRPLPESAMKIATFNINGIKARAAALADWLDDAKPDVAVLQEIKSVDAAFPREIVA